MARISSTNSISHHVLLHGFLPINHFLPHRVRTPSYSLRPAANPSNRVLTRTIVLSRRTHIHVRHHRIKKKRRENEADVLPTPILRQDRLPNKEGDPKVKDRLKGYLSFFIMPGKSRRVWVMGWGGEDINKRTVILLKISEITVVFMVKDSYIYSAKKNSHLP